MIDRTPHYLLDGRTGWRAAVLDSTAVLHGALSLQPLPGSARPLADDSGTFGGLRNATGVAVDGEDRVYILDTGACLLKRFNRCTARFETLPCIGPRGGASRELDSPHGLAISRANDIYVADSGNRRVQVFALRGLALRSIWGPYQVVRTSTETRVVRVSGRNLPSGTWLPWDIALSSHNWAFVTDYVNGLIHVFDPHGRWRCAYSGEGPSTPALVKPTRLALDQQGRIYIIQEGLSYVVVLNRDGTLAGTIQQPSEVAGTFRPASIAIDIHGNICLSSCFTQQIYFFQSDGNGGWCACGCSGCPPGYGGSMIFDRSGKALLAAGACGVCELTPASSYPLLGHFLSMGLDSRTYRCVWDRIFIHGSVPAGAAIRVDTFTSEAQKTSAEIAGLAESRWSTGQIDTDTDATSWDCLVRSEPGRYLWVRLTLSGDGSSGPAIEKIKIYYPRSSSLKYLPAVYRADPASSDFLDRFLSIFDRLQARTSGTITDIAHYFDPRATPANAPGRGGNDFLGWLATWLGMTLKSGWLAEKRRELLANAHRLYALRGTPKGLCLYIQLYAGVEPRVLESFRLRRWLSVSHSTLGNNSIVSGASPLNRLQIGSNSTIGGFQLIDYGNPALDLFNKYAYQFLVVVPRWPGAGVAEQQSLEQIIELAKPAHTVAQFQWAEPRLRIGIQSFVGVDTVIGKYPVGVVEGQGKLGYDTVLGRRGAGDAPQPMEVGRRSIIGGNSVLT